LAHEARGTRNLTLRSRFPGTAELRIQRELRAKLRGTDDERLSSSVILGTGENSCQGHILKLQDGGLGVVGFGGG
jgi:Xaa-Pro aminopeptidase